MKGRQCNFQPNITTNALLQVDYQEKMGLVQCHADPGVNREPTGLEVFGAFVQRFLESCYSGASALLIIASPCLSHIRGLSCKYL